MIGTFEAQNMAKTLEKLILNDRKSFKRFPEILLLMIHTK